jgi:hypothetical protein
MPPIIMLYRAIAEKQASIHIKHDRNRIGRPAHFQ